MIIPRRHTRSNIKIRTEKDGNYGRPGIWTLAIPSILGNLLASVVAIIQTKFIGSLGGDAVAAVGVGQRIFFAVQAVLLAVGAGTTALVARSWGAGDHKEASRVTLSSVILASGAGLIFMLVGMLFYHPIASIFGLDSFATKMAAETVFWQTAFAIGLTFNIIISSALRAAGDAWTPMALSVLAGLLNILFLYVFIFGHWGAPPMGPAGTAVAMGLSFTIGGLILLVLWMRQGLAIKLVRDGWFDRERYRRLFLIGFPALMEQLLFQVGFIAFLMLIGNFYGTKAFAAYNVGVNMLNIGMVVGFGFSIAGSTLVGQNLGAEDFEEAAQTGWRTCRMAVTSMAVLAIIIMVYAKPFARFFLGQDTLTIKYTVQFTYILAAMLPLLGVEVSLSGALRGAGDTRFPVISTFSGLIGMRCGLTLLFTWMDLPVIWVYGSLIGDYIVKAILLIWRFRSGRWKRVISNEALNLDKHQSI